MINDLEKTTPAQYDNIANEFQSADEDFPDVTRSALYKYINKMDLEGKSALDMGCGYGEDVAYLSSRGAKSYGIDVSGKMVDLTKSRCPAAIAVTAQNENIPYKNNTFSLVFSRYAIQHSLDVEKVFEEVNRVLEVGGEFVYLVTHPFRHYFEKETKDYWRQETVNSSILAGRVTVTEPSHTMEEYLNSRALRNFELTDMQELHDPAAQQMLQYGKYPCVLIMHYRKVR